MIFFFLEPTRRLTFGFLRSEVLGAFCSILIIWILTGVLVYLAIKRVITQEYEIQSTAMVITASCGVAFNIVMFIVLHANFLCYKNSNIHGHSHGGHTASSAVESDDVTHSHSHSKRFRKITKFSKHAPELTSSKNVSVANSNPEGEDSHQVDIIDVEAQSGSNHKSKKKHEKKKPENINLRAAAIHVIGDFIQSVGVLVAALIIYFKVNLLINVLSFKI